MVLMDVSIDGAASAAFSEALKALGDSIGLLAGEAPRRMAIMICKGFRAKTRQAPPHPRAAEMKFRKLQDPPKHVTKNGKDCRGWTVDRTAIGRGTFTAYLPIDNPPKRTHWPIFHRGLAKQSWGWVMHNIYNGAAPDSNWRRRRNDRRNPKDATRDSCSSASNGIREASGYARIANRLDYIGETLRGVSVPEVLRNTAVRMIGTIANRRLRKEGLKGPELRAAASEVAHEFKARFPL